MSADIENQTMDLLATTVEDEKKNVTYRWLSRSMGYSVNTAKQLMETYLSTMGKGKVHGTYYLARQDPQTGNQTISLISQDDLHVAIKDSTVIGYHIYSLEPSPLKDLSTLSVANSEASQLQQGKDINIYRVVHNRSVIVSRSNAKSAAPKTKPTPTQANQPATAPSTATPTTTLSATTSISSNTKSKPAAAASKASVMSFFGKAATAAPKTTTPTTTAPSSTPPSKSSTLNFKPAVQKRKAESMMSTSNNNINNNSRSGSRERVEEDDSDEEVDSEEERDRRLALSSRLDLDQDDVTESKINGRKAASPSESATLDINAIKKRQRNARLLAVDDDDEAEDEHYVTQKPSAEDDGSDEGDDGSVEAMSKEALIALNNEKERQRVALENMMLAPDEDSPMIDVEALDPLNEPSASADHTAMAATNQGTTPGRRRGVRAVTKRKTSRNDRGYMVTEDVVEMESFSEDDVPAPAPAPAPVRTEKTEPAKSKQEIGGPKKKAGSGNQSLLNFFSKKN
ncbi:DNA polymerase delta subunit 3 [Mortierella sp. AD094]|nr:DNA polymerase delta subunit 3 [Mortierella sp. AD094]